MDNELHELLYAMPPGTDYACDLSDLDDEDIPRDRIPKLRALLGGGDDFLAYKAACILCSWADDQGFQYLRRLVLNSEPLDKGWTPHRLRGYDDTYRVILSTFIMYWARKAGEGNGDKAQKELFEPVSRIVNLSGAMSFDISPLLRWMNDGQFLEQLPFVKNHLTEILKAPEIYHWKIADCAHLLMKLDPDFVQATLAIHGRTLADFKAG